MVNKIYKTLTAEQKSRGVIFSSCLSPYRHEVKDLVIHEVISINQEEYKDKPYELAKAEQEQHDTITRLLDDKFFNQSHFKFNIIRK